MKTTSPVPPQARVQIDDIRGHASRHGRNPDGDSDGSDDGKLKPAPKAFDMANYLKQQRKSFSGGFVAKGLSPSVSRARSPNPNDLAEHLRAMKAVPRSLGIYADKQQ